MSLSGCDDNDGGESRSVLPDLNWDDGNSDVVSNAMDGDMVTVDELIHTSVKVDESSNRGKENFCDEFVSWLV